MYQDTLTFADGTLSNTMYIAWLEAHAPINTQPHMSEQRESPI